jgi:hypothetical protein
VRAHQARRPYRSHCPSLKRDENSIEPRADNASRPPFARGTEQRTDHLDAKHFVDLARNMGIPARDAASQVMGLITERGRILTTPARRDTAKILD